MKSLAPLLLFVAAVAQAQVRESVTVEVIEVPVHVTAADGRPVRGLNREAFELRVDGRVVPIEYFDAVDRPAPAADASQTAASERVPARERRLYLLLFDKAFSDPARLARAQRAAEVAVARANAATDLFAVATYSESRGTQFVTPFISDRSVTLRALRTLTISRTADPLGMAMSDSERSDWLGATREGDSDYVEIGRDFGGTGANAMMDIGNEERQREKTRHVENLFGNLSDLAGRLAGLEGQKHLLYFSSGFPSALVHGGLGSFHHSPASGGPLARPNRILDEMSRVFASAGVVLDAVDIEGLRTGGTTSTYFGESLGMLAHATGGDLVQNRNDLGRALTELTDAQRVVYILGFNRRGRRGGTISVRVNGVPSGTRLSYRTGFGAAETRKEVDPLQLIDILLNDIPQNDITTRLTVTNSTALLELRPAELPDAAKEVDALLYVFNAEGLAVAGYEKRIVLGKRTPIVIRQSLDLPPGRYVAKAVVRAGGNGSLVGFARTELTLR